MTNLELLQLLSKHGTLCFYKTTKEGEYMVCDIEAWKGWLNLTFNEEGEVISIKPILPIKEPLD